MGDLGRGASGGRGGAGGGGGGEGEVVGEAVAGGR